MTRPVLLFFTFIFSVALFYTPPIALAATTGDTIESLKAEIASYQNQLKELGSQKVTLQSTISELTLKQKELAAQIKITQTKIATANSQIKGLNSSIGDTEESLSLIHI
jgi:peptidoglycan hydrolase CwlO-like protein